MNKAFAFERATQKDEWLTPPDIIKSLGEFDLDPCSPITRPWPTAKQHYTIQDDGLLQEWYGRVWLNPPYGSQTRLWLRLMARHDNGIVLIFARTETQMFFESVWPCASAMLFVEGRIVFRDVCGNKTGQGAVAPSVLIAYGENNVAPLRDCGIRGKFVKL